VQNAPAAAGAHKHAHSATETPTRYVGLAWGLFSGWPTPQRAVLVHG
jgi:hypothetical protein